MERKFKGIWIPKEIWLSEELTLQEKVMLVEIDSFDDGENGCWASNKYFSDFFNLSTRRIIQIISSLKEKGYINVNLIYEGKEVIERRIKINRPPYPNIGSEDISLGTEINFHRVVKKTNEGSEKNFLVDNISTNNIELINNSKAHSKKFIKPTLEELRNFISENNLNIDAESFIDYYESNGWKVGRNSMKDWKATARRWGRSEKKNVTSKPSVFKEVEKEKMSKEELEELENLFKEI